MSFWSEFKTFAMRGNALDLAVAVVIGAAFGKIVSSLVDGIIMPFIGILLGGINLSTKTFIVGHAVFKWGSFLQSVIDFTLVALSIFVILKIINSFKRKKDTQPETLTRQEELLTEIRNLLKQKNLA